MYGMLQFLQSISLISISSPMSLISLRVSWRVTHVLLCVIVCPRFLGLWMIFLFLIFQILITESTLTKTLLVGAFTQKPLASWIVHLKASLAILFDLTVTVLKVCWVTFLTSALNQSMQAGIEMIRIPHVHSNILMTGKLGVINSQFYRFLRLFSCKKLLVFQIVSLIVFLKDKGYPLKVLLKRTRGLVLKENFLIGLLAFGIFRMILLRVM